MNSKTKNIIKIVLDILMAITFAVLFNKMAFAGLAFHEIAGLAVGAAIVIHLLLNKAWVKGVTKKLFSKTIPVKTKVAYLVDVLLLISVALIIVTGILMSKVLFVEIITVRANVKTLHVAASYLSLLLIGIHVGLVWNKVMNIMKNLIKLPRNKVARGVSTGLAILLFLLGTYNIGTTGFLNKINPFATNQYEHGERSLSAFDSDIEADSSINIDKQAESDTALVTNNAEFQSGLGRSGQDKGFGQRSGSTSKTVQVIYQNISIMVAFAVLTNYSDKLIQGKRKRKRNFNLIRES